MEIKAVKLYEGGFMTEDFAFGGSADKTTLDATRKYASSLQNYLIDTGREIILVDPGLPKETTNMLPKDGIFYMMHGDITYTDAALVENKLSVVFEDKEAAKITLEKVRKFIKNNPTVYLSTHTPEGIVNLEEKKIINL